MKIYGLQKLSLLDYPGKMAAVVFTGGCNFKCPFCHNSELIDTGADDSISPIMEEEEFFDFLKSRKGLLEGVCVSGGEPVIQKDIGTFLERIKALSYPVKLDTNGSDPKKLKELCSENLVDYVAMDIKSDRSGYPQACGFGNYESGKWNGIIENVEESALFLKDKGEDNGFDYEFRTTVVKELHNADTFENIGKWLEGAKRYYLQPFTDRDTVVYGNLHAPSKEELETYRDILIKHFVKAGIRGI